MKYYFKLLLKKTDDQRKIKEEHRDIPHCGRGQLTARGPRRGQLSRGFGPWWQLREARWRGGARRDLRPGVFGRSPLPSFGPAGSHPARPHMGSAPAAGPPEPECPSRATNTRATRQRPTSLSACMRYINSLPVMSWDVPACRRRGSSPKKRSARAPCARNRSSLWPPPC